MVLLTITPSILEVLNRCSGTDRGAFEPRLADPQLGQPISHGQILDLWKQRRADGDGSLSLERLLSGSRIYVPPPPPKAEPVRVGRQTALRLDLTTGSRASTRP